MGSAQTKRRSATVATVKELYYDQAREMVKNSRHPDTITPENVYQKGNEANRRIVENLVAGTIHPKSHFANAEAMEKLAELTAQGKSCLILSEHYSNFDIPSIFYLLQQASKKAAEVADRIVAIASLKLNITSDFVLAFAESFSRVVVYPSRSLEALAGTDTYDAEKTYSREINRAALKQMIRLKYDGHIILVFPAGTRYRPGKPDTKRVLKEVDSYLKSFDYMVFVGSAGNILVPNPTEKMELDEVHTDVLVHCASDVIECSEFRRAAREAAPPDSDLKQAAADAVSVALNELHAKAEAERAKHV